MSDIAVPRPELIVLDVNETLSDMAPLAQRFTDVGASPGLAATWFAQVLRDGFALTAVGANEPFARIATGVLRGALASLDLDRPLDEAVAWVMDGFGGLSVHPDVPDGLRALHSLGIRLITLSNGSASVADALLERAGVDERGGEAAERRGLPTVGNRRPSPTPTPCVSAASRRPRRCWSRSIRGTSTAPPAPAWPPAGSIAPAPATPSTSPSPPSAPRA